jgi:hypothetical protein
MVASLLPAKPAYVGQIRAGTAAGYLAGSAALGVSPPLLLTGPFALQGYRPLRKRNNPSVDGSGRRSGMAPTQSTNCLIVSVRDGAGRGKQNGLFRPA